MNSTISCVEPPRLFEILTMPLQSAERQEFEGHLRTCARCQQLLWQVSSEAMRSCTAGENTSDHAASPTLEKPSLARIGPSTRLPEHEYLDPCNTPGRLGRLAHYELLSVIGRGGMGTVFKAHDEALQRPVALKLMAPELAASDLSRQRFIREARAAAAVMNDHVVAIHAVDDQRRLPYLVMQYIEGQSLQDRLVEKPLTVDEIIRISREMAEGMAAAHAKGLVHRDIKPANILLEHPGDRVKITDFGLARAVDDTSLSHSGAIIGTPLFMAPEQAQGEAVDHRADLFSLGVVMYAMCTGQSPFKANNTLAVLKRVCEDHPAPIHNVNTTIPGWLDVIIFRLMAKKPEDRFATAQEVAGLLDRKTAPAMPVANEMTTVLHVPKAPLTTPARTRRPWAVGALFVLVTMGAGYFYSLNKTPETKPTPPEPVKAEPLVVEKPKEPEAGDPEVVKKVMAAQLDMVKRMQSMFVPQFDPKVEQPGIGIPFDFGPFGGKKNLEGLAKDSPKDKGPNKETAPANPFDAINPLDFLKLPFPVTPMDLEGLLPKDPKK